LTPDRVFLRLRRLVLRAGCLSKPNEERNLAIGLVPHQQTILVLATWGLAKLKILVEVMKELRLMPEAHVRNVMIIFDDGHTATEPI
jgi:hypothetical protein